MKLIDISTRTHPNTFTMVDDEDFERLNKLKWYAIFREKLYACRSRGVGMAREIIACPNGMIVDHINGDSLDNQKSNLRICTPAQNGQNRRKQKPSTGGFRGVYRSRKIAKPFEGSISASGKKYYLGYFETAIECAIAYNNAAKELHGEFAVLNIIPGE